MKKNNKGFSLVELIIVIAIMAVLVGVLAPQFIKYVEQSRRSRDISTANEIREAVLAAIADNRVTASGSNVGIGTGALTVGSGASVDTIASAPTPQSHVSGASAFNVSWNANSGTCSVTVAGYDLTTEGGASAYKAVP